MTMGQRMGFEYRKAICLGALAVLIALPACNRNDDKRVAFDGLYFRTKARKVDDDLSRFTVTVPKVSRSLDGALQAGAYEGVRYCIAADGTSRIRWDVGPDTPREQLVISDDTLTLQGECNP